VSRMPNPVAIDWAAPPADQTEPVAFFGGSICHRKGVDVLVDAWRRMVADGVTGICRIVGPIEDYTPPAVRGLIVEGAADPREMPEQIRKARVVVLPSRSEGMPMILSEALAGARPFIATPVGGIRELAPSSDMIVPVGDANALAARMTAYLTDPGLASRAGRQAQEFCAQTRSPEVIDRRTREIYRGL
jgi:glycosyltransferase involved in cell wall biosynthesis